MSCAIKISVYTFLTNIKNTSVKYYHQDEATSHSAFAEEVYLLCKKNIRVASSDKLVFTLKFDVALRIFTMIPSWETRNPISKSASGFGLSHEVDKNGCDFLRDSPLSKSFFWFWIKNYFEFCSAKSPLPCIFASTIEIVATPSHRLLPPALSYFTQGIGFWNWFWKTIGKIDLDFKWAISLRKSIPPSLLPSRNRFSKALLASSILNLSGES